MFGHREHLIEKEDGAPKSTVLFIRYEQNKSGAILARYHYLKMIPNWNSIKSIAGYASEKRANRKTGSKYPSL